MKKLITILTAFVCLQSFSQQHYPIKNFLGAVAHPWDITANYGQSQTLTDRLQQSIVDLKLTGLRIYNDVRSEKDSFNLTYRLSPEGRGFETDKAIASLKSKSNISILYCYQGQPINIEQEWTVKSTVYKHPNSDAGLSSSYSEIAHDCFVLASRGGVNSNVPDYPLFVSPNWWEPKQTMLKGAGLYDIIEAGNEWDNQWSNQYPLNGSQYAAAWSAVYDSVKKADPLVQVSTTGLCNADPKTLTDAWAWTSQNRGKFPADLIQVHSYPWAWSMGLSGGLPGELSIIPEVKKMVNAANGIPVIIGEWSWDIHPDSPINAPAFSSYTSEQCRGNLGVRTVFEFSAIGVKAAYWYRINQDYFPKDPSGGNTANDNNGTSFATSALRRQIDDSCHFVRTTVGDYFAQISYFGDYVFSKAIRDDSVVILKFTKQGGADLYVMWTVEKITPYTDSKGVSHPLFHERKYNYQFNASGIRYDLNDDSSGVLKQQPFYPGTVELSSKPLFITTFTILPVQETTSKPHVIAPEYYDVKVYDFFGNVIVSKKHADLRKLKADLPRNKFLIIQYWNDKIFKTEKIYKQ